MSQSYDWEAQVREAVVKQWRLHVTETGDAVDFFRRAFIYTQHPEKAWFGVHQKVISLVVGGIFLAAFVASSKDRGVWLLLDGNAVPVDGWVYQPAKSTRKSKHPLVWFHTADIRHLSRILDREDIWQRFSSATDKIFSSGVSSDRDGTQQKRKKLRLAEFFWDRESPVVYPDEEVQQPAPSAVYPDEVQQSAELVEGAVTRVTVNAYERNREARERCIAHYSAVCYICGFDFEQRYGDVGRGMIHVHHERPLSTIGGEYTVDPIADLKPVCPNCHAIIHKRNPAFSVEDVRAMLRP